MKYIDEDILKPKEKAVYRSICKYIFKNHYAPSLMDLAADTKISVASMRQYLEKLQAKGLINYEKTMSRTIKLCKYEYKYEAR